MLYLSFIYPFSVFNKENGNKIDQGQFSTICMKYIITGMKAKYALLRIILRKIQKGKGMLRVQFLWANFSFNEIKIMKYH